jgi:hypothetical protein
MAQWPLPMTRVIPYRSRPGTEHMVCSAWRREALSTYCRLRPSSGKQGDPPIGIGPLGCRRSRDFVPALESWGQDAAIGGGREPVASRSEMLGNGPIRGEEPLHLPG